MIKPQAICIEDLTAPAEAARYLRCVALVGRQPGLRLDETGKVVWQSPARAAGELWVSQDERLILYRPEGAPPLTLRRAGRSLEVPYGQPVVIIDQDQIEVNTRHLRIHLHGETRAVAAPAPVPVQANPLKQLGQAATAAAILGAALTAGGCVTPTPAIEIRETPPAPTAPTSEPPAQTLTPQGTGTPIATETLTPTVTSTDTSTPLSPTLTELPPSATPTINVLENPPTATAPPRPVALGEGHTLQKIIQSRWTVSQAYSVENRLVWGTGTLAIADGVYTFTPARAIAGPSVSGALDFLFDHPRGEFTLDYPEGITPEDTFAYFAPGEVVATCTFHADSALQGEFLIRVGAFNNLYFIPLSGKTGLWNVIKQ